MTTDELERHLRGSLRETLDREQGPHSVWTESLAARRVAELDRSRRRWPLRALGIAAVIGATAAGAVLLAGALKEPAETANGWIAFTVAQQGPAGDGIDTDIWFAALDEPARRVIGGDNDLVDQQCPAFSPDGRSLAYGRAVREDPTLPGAARREASQNATLVVADVFDDGTVVDRLTRYIGEGLPAPCPVWSPDGDQLAFGVPQTSPINPDRSGEGSAVWVVNATDGEVSVLPDMLAVDLDWSPDGSVLAVAGGVETASGEGVVDGVQDSRIHLFEPSSGTLRTLDDTLGVVNLAWSPDGKRIAYVGRGPQPDSPAAHDGLSGLLVIDPATGQQETLSKPYGAIHGVGPVWSPDGETIAYQRQVGCCEKHEVVLVRPDDRSGKAGFAAETVMPIQPVMADGPRMELFPWRVTWSPDGKDLLYVAWTFPSEGVEQTVLVAVPTDPDAPAELVADLDGISPYDASDDTMRVPVQTWGRRIVPSPNPEVLARGNVDLKDWGPVEFEATREGSEVTGHMKIGPHAGLEADPIGVDFQCARTTEDGLVLIGGYSTGGSRFVLVVRRGSPGIGQIMRVDPPDPPSTQTTDCLAFVDSTLPGLRLQP